MIPPNRLYGPKDFFAGPFLICGDGGEDLISLTDSQITKYEKKYHSPLIFLELYPEPITLKCTPELYAKCMGDGCGYKTEHVGLGLRGVSKEQLEKGDRVIVKNANMYGM